MVFILKQNDIGKFVITDILYFFILFFSNFLNFYTNSQVLENLSLLYIL